MNQSIGSVHQRQQRYGMVQRLVGKPWGRETRTSGEGKDDEQQQRKRKRGKGVQQEKRERAGLVSEGLVE